MDQAGKLRTEHETRACLAGILYRVAARHVDLLFVPWVLDASALRAYLLARSLSILIPAGLAMLAARVRPHLLELADRDEGTTFQAAAARVNLGYLMVNGALALIVIICAPYFAALVGLPYEDFVNVLLWAVLGQSASILFGATGLLMKVVGFNVLDDFITGFTSALFLFSAILLNAGSTLAVVQTFAAAQLSQAAICAIFLSQQGIWPGLTALFHKNIRLS